MESIQLSEGLPDPGTLGREAWIAVGVMVASTIAGAQLARRNASRAGLVLVTASGMMLVTCAADLLPESFHESTELGLPAWVVAVTALIGFVVMTLFTRKGCGCDAELTEQTVGVHRPGRHRQVRQAVGAMSVGLGAAAALSTHRVVEGAALALAFSLPVILMLVVSSVSDGLALAAMLQETGQRLTLWLAVACTSPAVGVIVATARPLPPTVVPVALALVAGVILRISVVGLKLAARKREKGQLPPWHVAAAATTTVTLGAFLLAAH